MIGIARSAATCSLRRIPCVVCVVNQSPSPLLLFVGEEKKEIVNGTALIVVKGLHGTKRVMSAAPGDQSQAGKDVRSSIVKSVFVKIMMRMISGESMFVKIMLRMISEAGLKFQRMTNWVIRPDPVSRMMKIAWMVRTESLPSSHGTEGRRILGKKMIEMTKGIRNVRMRQKCRPALPLGAKFVTGMVPASRRSVRAHARGPFKERQTSRESLGP